MKKNVHEIEIKLEQEWVETLDKAFKKKQKEVNVAGFRKGSIPKEMYIKKFGIESLYMDAVDMAINIAYRKLLDESKLVPAMEPAVDVKDINEKEITFKFTVITRPEVKLGEYKNLGIKLEKPKVSADDVKKEIEALQNQMADLVVKENAEIVNGDTAVIDFKGYVDGELLDGGSGESFPLEIGSGSFIPGFEEGLVGKKTGDKVTLELTFPSNYVENLKDKDVTFEVTINEVKTRVVPEINEDFFADLGYDDVKTLDDLKKKIKEYLTEEQSKKLEDEYIDKCLDKAVENMEVDINEEIIDNEVHGMMHQYEEQLKMQGLSIDKFYEITGQTHEDLHKNMEPEAIKRIKYRYLIEEVAKVENIDFTEEEVKKEAEKMAENYGISVEELIKAYGTIDIVKYDMTMHKALEIIKESNKGE